MGMRSVETEKKQAVMRDADKLTSFLRLSLPFSQEENLAVVVAMPCFGVRQQLPHDVPRWYPT